MRPSSSGPDRAGVVALLLALAFAAFYAAISRGVLLYGDDVLMFQVTEAIVERGEVSVTSNAPPRTAVHSIEGVDGRRYAKYGIGQSLAAIPFYAAAGPLFDRFDLPESRDRYGNVRTGARVFGAGLTNAVAGGIGVGLCFLLATALGSPVPAALGAAVLLGAATLWPHYAATFLSETLAGSLLAVAVLAFATFERKAHTGGSRHELPWLAASGFAAGALVATKVATAAVLWPLVVWICVVAWRRGRARKLVASALAWALPFAAWVTAIGLYNRSRFGGVLATGYEDEAKQFTTPLVEGLAGLLASPAKGILLYSPAVVLPLFGLFFARRRAKSLLPFVIGGIGVSLLLVFSMYYQWYGGGAWGPRFLVPLLPIWLALAAPALEAIRSSRWPTKLLAAIVVAAGLATTAAGIVVPFDRDPSRLVDDPDSMREAAWSAGRSPLLANFAELPGALALTASKLVETDDALATGAALAAEGIPDFAFARYGSHALLGWTRAGLLVGALLAGFAAWVAARAQKASESSPPQ